MYRGATASGKQLTQPATPGQSTQAGVKCPIICPTLPDVDEIAPDIRRAFASGRITCGEQVAAFEDDVCRKLGVRNTIAVSCATSGLMLLLRALDLPRGSEVIVPAFTFAATAHALLWNGLKPVFCDCEPESFTLDTEAARRLINERTSAIYPVCIFGVPGDLDAYEALAREHGLALLFDSAQGLCASYCGEMLGNFGAGEVFSLSPTKTITALEGGLVTTNDDDLAAVIRQMRDYGKDPGGDLGMNWLGLSARMTEVNAIVGRWSFARADQWIANRKGIMDRYGQRLGSIPGLSFQVISDHCTSSRNYIVVLLDDRDAPITRDDLYYWLRDRGIQTKRYFYPAVHNQLLYRDVEPSCADRLPVSETVSASSLALPMYSHMPMELVDEICDCVLESVRYATSI